MTQQARNKDYTPRVDAGDLDLVLPAPDAARFLGVAPDTLFRWRKSGRGPKYIRLSATLVGYRKRALLHWLEQREFESTSAETVADSSSEDQGATLSEPLSVPSP